MAGWEKPSPEALDKLSKAARADWERRRKAVKEAAKSTESEMAKMLKSMDAEKLAVMDRMMREVLKRQAGEIVKGAGQQAPLPEIRPGTSPVESLRMLVEAINEAAKKSTTSEGVMTMQVTERISNAMFVAGLILGSVPADGRYRALNPATCKPAVCSCCKEMVEVDDLVCGNCAPVKGLDDVMKGDGKCPF